MCPTEIGFFFPGKLYAKTFKVSKVSRRILQRYLLDLPITRKIKNPSDVIIGEILNHETVWAEKLSTTIARFEKE